MRYLLDTNICIHIARRKSARLLARLDAVSPGDLGMSIVTYLELVYGAMKSSQPHSALEKVERIRHLVSVMALTADVTRDYGRIRIDLEKKGTTIGPHDLPIAAHAASLGLTLVTANEPEFARVKGLRVENWARGA